MAHGVVRRETCIKPPRLRKAVLDRFMDEGRKEIQGYIGDDPSVVFGVYDSGTPYATGLGCSLSLRGNDVLVYPLYVLAARRKNAESVSLFGGLYGYNRTLIKGRKILTLDEVVPDDDVDVFALSVEKLASYQEGADYTDFRFGAIDPVEGLKLLSRDAMTSGQWRALRDESDLTASNDS